MTEPTASQPSGAERRASVRYLCRADGFSSDNSSRPTSALNDAWSATIRDLSAGGVGIIVNRRFEPGSLLAVELQDAEQTVNRSLLVRIVRVTRESEDRWILGCAFTSNLTDAELLALMSGGGPSLKGG